MIHDINDDIHPFDDPAREREWLAQENAMRQERLQLDPRNDDARTRRYRLLARALKQPPQENLEPDFARRLAAQVTAGALRRRDYTARFELGLIAALSIVLLAAGVIYGSGWLAAVAALPLPTAPAMRWLLAFAGCLGLSWLLGRWQRQPHASA